MPERPYVWVELQGGENFDRYLGSTPKQGLNDQDQEEKMLFHQLGGLVVCLQQAAREWELVWLIILESQQPKGLGNRVVLLRFVVE
jgi:hypothetical protein